MWTAFGVSITSSGSSATYASPMSSNSRVPLPKSTGATWTEISSRRPARRSCWPTSAPLIPTILSPAASFACATALSSPSVTNR
jgi:hypothetical protein